MQPLFHSLENYICDYCKLTKIKILFNAVQECKKEEYSIRFIRSDAE